MYGYTAIICSPILHVLYWEVLLEGDHLVPGPVHCHVSIPDAACARVTCGARVLQLEQDRLHLRPWFNLLQQVGSQHWVNVPDNLTNECQKHKYVKLGYSLGQQNKSALHCLSPHVLSTWGPARSERMAGLTRGCYEPPRPGPWPRLSPWAPVTACGSPEALRCTGRW